MRQILPFLLAFCVSANASAQSCAWTKITANSGDDRAIDIVTDSIGNTYTVGTYSGIADFDPDPAVVTLNSGSSSHFFVSKFSSDGTFLWVKDFSYGISGPKPYAIELDHAGNVVIGGMFVLDTDFDPGVGEFNVVSTNHETGNVFILKLSPTGQFIWVKTVAAYSFKALSIDLQDNIIYSGELSGSTDLDPGSGSFIPAPSTFFVSKLTKEGNFVWAKTSLQPIPVTSLVADNAGNIFMTGLFIGSRDFDFGAPEVILTSSDKYEAYLLKLNAAGEFVFVKEFKTYPYISLSTEHGKLAVDASGNIIFSGEYGAVFDANPGPGTEMLPAGNFASGNSVFVIKLSNSGTFIFAKSLLNQDDFTTDAMCVNNEGDIFLRGSFRYTVDFNPGPGDSSLTSNLYGYHNLYFLKLNSLGEFVWVRTLFRSEVPMSRGLIRCDQNGSVYISGYTSNPSTTCTYTPPGGGYDMYLVKLGASNMITGKCFMDTNGDGVQQPGEKGMRNIVIRAINAGTYLGITDSLGRYTIAADMGSYTTSPTQSSSFATISPTTHSSSFGTALGTIDSLNNFAFQPLSSVNDVEVTITNLTAARPGFSSSYRITFTNKGTTTLSGATQLLFPTSATFVSSSAQVASNMNQLLSWNYSGLLPLESRNIDVIFTISRSATMGQILQYYVTAEPVSGDVTVSDNRDTLKHEITSSYDPNDKTVVPSGDISLSFVRSGSYLDYTIRFQNTGTDTAINIILRDTLNNNLDAGSFQMISASHNYKVKISGDNRLEWTFSNIFLPDSNRNEPLSHGYVRFRLKTNNNLQLNTKVYNTAAIFFDYNEKVPTNLTENTVVDIVLPLGLLSFTGQLHGSKTYLNWKTVNEQNASYFEVQKKNGNDFTYLGKIFSHAENGQNKQYNFVDERPVVGNNFYRLKIVDADNHFTYSPVVAVELKALTNISISPNPAQNYITAWHSKYSDNTFFIITDMKGAVVKKVICARHTSTTRLDIENLTAGLYNLRWEGEGKKWNGIFSKL